MKHAVLLALSVATFGLSACSFNTTAQNPTTTTAISQPPAKAVGVWIDVRSAEEYADGHLQGALNITPDQIASHIEAIESNKNAPINLYCRSGRRAEVARKTLLEMGYTNVVNHGGYQDLYDKGYR